MDGFVSIDAGTPAVSPDVAAHAPIAADAASAAAGQRGTPEPSGQAVDAFMAAMAKPMAENAAIEAAFGTAVKSFAAAMAAVDAAHVSAPVSEVPAEASAVPAAATSLPEPGRVAPGEVSSVSQKPEVGTIATVAGTVETSVTAGTVVAPDASVVPAAPAVNAETVAPKTDLPAGVAAPAVNAETVAPKTDLPAGVAAPAVPETAVKAADGTVAAPSAPQTQGSETVPVQGEPAKPVAGVPAGTEDAASAEAKPVLVESGKPQPVVRGKDVDETPEARAENIVAAGIAPRVQEAAPVVQADPSGVQSVEAVSARTVEVADRVAKAMSASEVLLQAAEAVADAILVSPGLLRGEGEIRVQLKPDVLEGTEIRIGVAGTKMEVVFMPRTEDMSALIEQCRPQLEQHLAARIHRFNVGVSVDRKSRVRDE